MKLAPNAPPSRLEELAMSLLHSRGRPWKERLEGFEDLIPTLFQGANLAGEDLGGEDLEGFDFSLADMTGVRLEGARIAGAAFWQTRVTRAQLEEAADWETFAAGWKPPGRTGPIAAWAGDVILLDPLGPEFVVLRAPGPDAERPDGLDEGTWRAWRDGRLAVAHFPVTVRQAHAAGLRNGSAEPDRDLQPALLTPQDVHFFVDWIRGRIGGGVEVPTHGLWSAIAKAGGLPEPSDGTSEGAHPWSAPRSGGPWVNRLGLADIIGNVREFVRVTQDDRLMVTGGDRSDSLEACLARIDRPETPLAETDRYLAGLRLVCRFEAGGLPRRGG